MNEDYLDEKEQSAVIAFNSNEVMRRAVEKVLLASIFHQGTLKPGDKPNEFNFAFVIAQGVKSDEQMGQELRAATTALNYLKTGFERLSEIKREEPKAKTKNPAI